MGVNNSRNRRADPSEMKLREARDRYLRRRGADATESSIDAWWYRLKLFAQWTESVGIESVGELRRLDIDDYYEFRAADVKPVTLEGEMWTLLEFIKYLESLGAVEDGLSKSVRIPDVDDASRSNDSKLSTENALSLLEGYRNDPKTSGTRAHVFIELAWHTGARTGGLVALDVRDVNLNKEFVEFRHRPDTGTPLKNKYDGERSVAIPAETVDAIRTYLGQHRYDVHDEHGRAPLIASMKGRPTPNTPRVWSYLGTLPCIHAECPHGKDPETCQWTEFGHASKCPSSRSPHKIRTGSITWQLNLGIPVPVVAQRVNADVKTIAQHYDKADRQERRKRQRQQMEQRREYIDRMKMDGGTDAE